MTGRIALVALAGIGLACTTNAPAAPTAAPTAVPVASSATTRWVRARTATETPLLEAPAQIVIETAGRAVIAAPLRARILAVRVEPGSATTVGAPLVDVALPEAAAAAASLLAAQGEVAAYEARATQLEALQQEGLTRAADLATVRLELARLRGARDIAATTLRTAGFVDGDARALAASGGRTTLRAPLAGVVTAVGAVPGASRSPDDPLVEIATGHASRMEARLVRPLPVGVRVEFVAPDGTATLARLLRVSPVREGDGTLRAWFELTGPAPAGSTGRMRATLTDVHAVSIPARAIVREHDATFVWRRAGDATVRAPIHVLATSGTEAIVDGLAVDDEIAGVGAAVQP